MPVGKGSLKRASLNLNEEVKLVKEVEEIKVTEEVSLVKEAKEKKEQEKPKKTCVKKINRTKKPQQKSGIKCDIPFYLL